MKYHGEKPFAQSRFSISEVPFARVSKGILMQNLVHVSERLSTETSFDTDAKSKSKMAYRDLAAFMLMQCVFGVTYQCPFSEMFSLVSMGCKNCICQIA